MRSFYTGHERGKGGGEGGGGGKKRLLPKFLHHLELYNRCLDMDKLLHEKYLQKSSRLFFCGFN
jgi:hypothetical protein